ncbi:hypothetical protein HXZ66_02985 [Bacillus sp. A116_S68]|jgi:hypothetical protein|nr:hypothetical protein HXZ66_02985 [Bacillus sp. A116_S68]
METVLTRVNYLKNQLIKEILEGMLLRGWRVRGCNTCDNTIITKQDNMRKFCDWCSNWETNTWGYPNKKYLKSNHPARQVKQSIVEFLSNKRYEANSPKQIWETHGDQIFVGSGLEYLYGFMYRGTPLPRLPTFIFQPSIRLRTNIQDHKGVNQMIDNFMSLAFTNLSIMKRINFSYQYVSSLDEIISMMSSIGVHASRVTFLVHNSLFTLKQFGSSFVIRIFVDGLEVGDHVALLGKDRQPIIVESGFGLERLTARVISCSYDKVFHSYYSNGDSQLLLYMHALTLISMSNVPYSKYGAWAKSRIMGQLVVQWQGKMDSWLLFQDLYYNWAHFVKDPADIITSYHQFLSISNISNKLKFEES